MSGTHTRSIRIHRPAPLWVQGLVTGITVTLFAVTIPIFLHDNSDGVLTGATTALVYACVAALSALAAVYIPSAWSGTASGAAGRGDRANPADRQDAMDRLAAYY